MARYRGIGALPIHKVVVVNGDTDVLSMLETVLDAGNYDMVFVESGDRAYSQIKLIQPHLVILCTRLDQFDGFQLLTMLKLDPETRSVPVLTYASECESDDCVGEILDQDNDYLIPLPALRMN